MSRSKKKRVEGVWVIALLALVVLGTAYQFIKGNPLWIGLSCGSSVTLLIFISLLGNQYARKRRAVFMARDSLYRDYSPGEFENVTAEILRQMGYQARVTASSGDDGLDIILTTDRGDKIGVQCKRYSRDIGPDRIREFMGALKLAGFKKGFFVSTSDFTKAAFNTAKRSGMQIMLVDGERLASWKTRAENHINTSLLTVRWWGMLTNGQKVFLIALFGMVIFFFFSGLGYVFAYYQISHPSILG